jgi:hypothetical protein
MQPFDTVWMFVNMARAKQIESEIQLLVEGKDEYNFFEAIIEHLSQEHLDIQIHDFGGVNRLRGFLRAFVLSPGFESTVRSIGIVRDAETCAVSAFQSVRSSLENAGLPSPAQPGYPTDSDPKVTVLILPGDNRPGMLETLLCESFKDSPEDQCIDGFLNCVNAISGISVDRPYKARAHAYLATKPDPHVSVGVAAKNGYWDLDHPVLGDVRSFVTSIA